MKIKVPIKIKLSLHLLNDYNWLTYLGAFFELLGVYLLGEKNPWGFYSNMAGLLCWLNYSMLSGRAPGLIIVSLAGIIMNILASYKWLGGYVI